MILGSAALRDYFAAERLHGRLHLWPPVLAAAPAAPAPGAVRTAAFVGGAFRRRAFAEAALPGLIAAAAGRPLTLHLRRFEDGWPDEALLGRCAAAGIEAVPFAFELDYPRFLARARGWSADLLLHPRAATANADYKTLGTLAVAAAIGALPVVAREGAFAGLDPADGVALVAGDAAEHWRQALAPLLDAPERLAEARQRFAAYCARAFSDRPAAALLDALLAAHEPAALARAAAPAASGRLLDRLRRALAGA